MECKFLKRQPYVCTHVKPPRAQINCKRAEITRDTRYAKIVHEGTRFSPERIVFDEEIDAVLGLVVLRRLDDSKMPRGLPLIPG